MAHQPARRGRRAAAVAALLSAACGNAPPAARPALDHEAAAFAVADSLRDTGRSAEAVARYLALRDSFDIVGDTAGAWRAQLWWADGLRRLGHRDSARAGLDRAMALAAGDPSREGWTRVMLSQLLEREGRPDTAAREADRALALARGSGDVRLEVAAQSARGTAFAMRGLYRESLAADSASLTLRRTLGASPRALAEGLNEVGIGYRHLGRYADAARAYEEALGISRGLDNPVLSAMLLHNLANIRSATGDVELALDHLAESLRYSEQLEHPQGMALNHQALSELYLRADNRAAARSHVERGLEISRRSGFAYAEVLTLESLGRLELDAERLPQARAALERGRTLADSAGFARERVAVRTTLARTAIAQGDAREAVRWAEAAVSIAELLGDPEALFEALEARAAALEARGGGPDAGDSGAAEAYLRAVDLLESWRGRIALGDLRMGIADPRMGAHEGAIRTLIARGRAGAAFDVAERARARLLRELMAERDRGPGDDSPEDSLRERLRLRVAARARAGDADARAALDRDIDGLAAALETFEARARQRESGVRHPAPASLAEVQAGLLRPDRALLAFFWGERDVYGWWITATEARAARLGPADSLNALIDFLRGTVEDPSARERWRAPARRAFRELVAPLAPTPAAEILVLADGALAYIPIEVLIPGAASEPWGAARRFSYGPSASVLLDLERAAVPADWDRAVLAVGNPAFDGARRDGEARREGPLRSLPHAGEEARAVQRLFRGEGADRLLGRRATLERWLGLEPARYRFLHFAVHARVSERHPQRTRLVLAGGALDLPTIRRLRIQPALVTLSACETALGRRVRGEGMIGLPHAFLAAGAAGVVVTLWRIEDRSAAEFMVALYRELHAGRSPAEALLVVRRRHLEAGGADAHPSRWAPFVLVGGSAGAGGERRH